MSKANSGFMLFTASHCRCRDGSARYHAAEFQQPGRTRLLSGPDRPIRTGRTVIAVFCILTFLAGRFGAVAAAQEASAPASDRQHLILILGAPGTDEYKSMFMTWAARWEEAALKGGSEHTVIGRVNSEPNPDVVSEVSASDAADSTTHQKPTANAENRSATANPGDFETPLEKLKAAIASAGSVTSTEPLWIVFIGHGTFDGRTASLNLPGPDISAEQLSALLSSVNRPVAFVGCASCTAPFVNALSSPGRVIISATKDGNQIQFCRFGDAMSLAISGLDADINRDGQTSLLEAWLFAARRTAEFYKTEGRLATEHALLDDNGDAKGTRAEVYEGDHPKSDIEAPETLDGKLAARWHFVRSSEERLLTAEQRQIRDALEAKVDQIRRRKDTLEESDYLQQLEELLLPLARLYESAEEPRSR